MADYEPRGTFGDSVSLNLPFSGAVDDLTGDRYVGSFLLPGGEGFVGGWTIKFGPQGGVLGPVRTDSLTSSVAVRQSNGHVYIRDNLGAGPSSPGGITIYDREGVQVGTSFTMADTPLWGQIAVDEETGNVYAAGAEAVVRIYNTSGVEVGTVSGEDESELNSPTGVALDADGNVYVADNLAAGGRVQKFDSDGNFLEVISSEEGEVSVAVDQNDGDIFVGALAEPMSAAGFHVIAFDSSGEQFDDFAGGEIGANPGLPVWNQPAVDSTTGEVIVPDATNNVVRVYAEPVAPTVTTGEATSVGQTSATLEGTVNPNAWEITECEFAYGEAGGSLSETAECDQTVGDGSSPVEVSADVSGLDPNTEYEFELVAANDSFVEEGGVESFTTLPNAASVSGASGTASGQNAATVSATVDAQGGEASCVVQWGTTTDYGKEIPCDPATISGAGGKQVSASLTGLEAGTTYHFRVLATNAGGSGQATGSFKTDDAPLPPAPPVVISPPPPTGDDGAAKAACVKKANQAAKKSIQAANKKVSKAKGKKAKAKAKKAAAKAKQAANRKKAAALKKCR